MDDQVQRLVDKAWKRYQETPEDQRLIIGIAGIPGSGKTTLAQIITSRINALATEAKPSIPPPATVVPMDGYHFTRAALSAMPDPANAHARRGAPFTFDAPKFLALLEALRGGFLPSPSSPDEPPPPILAPSFDHAVKDPKEGDIAVLPSHRVVVIEGLYLALDQDVWRDAAALFDELWFVDADFEVARKRLRERHLRAGIVKDLEAGDRRAMENDLPNGQEILDHRVKVDEVVHSREDGSWVHE